MDEFKTNWPLPGWPFPERSREKQIPGQMTLDECIADAEAEDEE